MHTSKYAYKHHDNVLLHLTEEGKDDELAGMPHGPGGVLGHHLKGWPDPRATALDSNHRVLSLTGGRRCTFFFFNEGLTHTRGALLTRTSLRPGGRGGGGRGRVQQSLRLSVPRL